MNQRLIATIGMFDGVHHGHRFLINFLKDKASENALVPTVFTFNHHPLSIINPEIAPQQLSTTSERIELLYKAGIERVELLSFDSDMRKMSAQQFIAMLHDQYNVASLILGFNNRFGHDRITKIEQYQYLGNRLGVNIIQAPEYSGSMAPISSSIIRKFLYSAQITKATEALGRYYTITGKVITGRQLGRTIGFPTANICPTDLNKLIPANGAYISTITTADGIKHPAMLNIGSRPTVDTDKAPISIEAHLLDFSGDLYGNIVTISFIQYLREERQFQTLNNLKAQLSIDADTVRNYFKMNPL